MSALRVAMLTCALALGALAAACALRDVAFGRACVLAGDCPEGYRCFTGACVPSDFPDERVDAGPGPPASDRCDDATVIALGQAVQGSTSDAFDDGEAPCAGDGAPERYYAVDLPAAASLVARLSPTGYDAALYALGGCGALDLLPDTCTDDDSDNYAEEVLVLPAAGPGRVIFALDGANPAIVPVAGSYTFVVEELAGCPVGTQRLGSDCVGVLATPTMTRGRTNLTATLLDDERVLVVGGRTGATMSTTASVEIFDPADDSFTPTGDLLRDRARHTAVLLDDGRVFVAGGVSGDDGIYAAIADTEYWDPDTGQWSAGPTLPSARDLFTATRLQDGAVLVVGGRDGATTHDDAHLLLAGAFVPVLGPLTHARFGHTATLLPDGDVLIAGGRVGPDSITIEDAERYDVGGGGFGGAGFGQSRGGHTATLLDDGRVLVAGGFARETAGDTTALGDTDWYEIAEDDWELGPSLQQPRLFAGAARLGDHGVLLLGGDVDGPLGSVELFSPLDDTWQRLPSLVTPRLALTAVALHDGRVLVLGGDGGTGEEIALASAELYGVVP